VAAPSLAGFKARLDGALSTLVWWKMSLLMAGGLEPGDLQGPFQPKPCYDSIIYRGSERGEVWLKGGGREISAPAMLLLTFEDDTLQVPCFFSLSNCVLQALEK